MKFLISEKKSPLNTTEKAPFTSAISDLQWNISVSYFEGRVFNFWQSDKTIARWHSVAHWQKCRRQGEVTLRGGCSIHFLISIFIDFIVIDLYSLLILWHGEYCHCSLTWGCFIDTQVRVGKQSYRYIHGDNGVENYVDILYLLLHWLITLNIYNDCWVSTC